MRSNIEQVSTEESKPFTWDDLFSCINLVRVDLLIQDGRMLRWLLILTKPCGERAAQVNLERQGYRIYYPRLLRPVLYRGRWTDRIVSLFPRYLFLQFDVAWQSLSPVRSTLGVANIVRFGSDCAVIPDVVVDSLMRRADPVSGLHRLSRTLAFESGSLISIIAGAFEGLEGIFERESGDDRVVVLLTLLGRSTPVRIHSRFVVPSPAREARRAIDDERLEVRDSLPD